MQNTQKSSLSWWMYLLNGVLMIVLGIWMLKTPMGSFNAMALVVGIIVMASGITEAVLSVYYRQVLWEWGWSLLAGVVDIIIGAFLITNPRTMLAIITFFIAAWLVIRGVLFLRDSLTMKKQGAPRWKMIMILGAGFLVLAAFILWHPEIVGLTLMIWLAIAFLSLGFLRVLVALKIRSISNG